MEMQLNWPSIRVRVDVAQNNSTLEVHLPVELLKQLENDSGFKYCAGNGIGVSVDN
jgi:hypothetical protein